MSVCLSLVCLSSVCLSVYDRKCEIYLPSAKENNVNRFSVPIVSSGVDILGMPIGNDSYVQSRLANQRLQVKAFVLNCST